MTAIDLGRPVKGDVVDLILDDHRRFEALLRDLRDSSADQGLAFVKKAGVTYPSIYDVQGKAVLAFAGKAPMSAIPTTVVLDKQGRVAAVIAGELPSETTLVDVVEQIADESGTTDG